MATRLQSLPARTRVRKALGRMRRSPAVAKASESIALQLRRARQRFHGRFVRGVWLETAKYVASAPPGELGVFLPSDTPAGRIVVAAPTFVPFEPPAHPGDSIRIDVPAPGTAVLERPWVVGPSGAVIGRDRRLLWDLSYEWPGEPQCHTTYALNDLSAEELPGTSLTLAAMGAADNYFHFLLNSVARLAYVQRTGRLVRPDHYLVSGPVTPFLAETLALLEIPANRLIGLDRGVALRPNRLLAPSLVRHPFVVPAHVCEFLRATILAAAPPRSPAPRRIFIDRADAGARRIRNLDALKPLLADHGIESVRLAGRSVLEQAALFRDADLVIANHGAALSNLVFCDPGTRVLQILAPGMIEREYRTIAQHGQLRHDYLVADFATPDDAQLARKQRDLCLAPETLQSVLTAEFPSSLTLQSH